MRSTNPLSRDLYLAFLILERRVVRTALSACIFRAKAPGSNEKQCSHANSAKINVLRMYYPLSRLRECVGSGGMLRRDIDTLRLRVRIARIAAVTITNRDWPSGSLVRWTGSGIVPLGFCRTGWTP